MGVSAMVGREVDLDRIASFLASARQGPRGLVIEDEAGSGKTTVWETSLATVVGADVLSCRPAESEATLSFAALNDLLGSAIDDVPIDLPAPQRRALDVALGLDPVAERAVDHRAVGAATLSLLVARSRQRPLVIAIDDLHWLDLPSARAIGFAFRRLTVEPVALFATARPQLGTTPAAEHADVRRDRRVERLRLTPLSVGAVEHVLRDQLELTLPRTALVQLHATAGGNPLYAVELGRAVIESGSMLSPGEPLSVTGDLRALLTARLRRVSDEVRTALLLVALSSNPVEDVLAGACGHQWDQAIGDARRAGIVRADGGRVRFVHPLFAGVVVADATDRERRDAHRRLAMASNDAEQRARHISLTIDGHDVNAAAALEGVAHQAMQRGAPDAAAELAELSCVLTPPGDAADLCRRNTLAGQARFDAGDTVRALEHLSTAEVLASAGPERAGVRLRVARVRYHHDNIGAAGEVLAQARLDADDDVRLQAAIDHDLAYTFFAAGDLRLTRHHAAAAAESAECNGTVHILADALGQVALADFMLGTGVHDDLLSRALSLEDWDEPRPALLRPSVAAAHIRSWSDRLGEAHALLDHAERELLERGDDASMPFLWYHRAELECFHGEWRRGLELAVAADRLAIQTRQEGMRALTCYAAALLHAHLGHAEETREYTKQGLTVAATTGHAVGGALNLAVLGFLELSEGHPDVAHRIFTAIVAQATSNGFDEPGSAWWLIDAIEAATLVGDLSAASELVEWVETRARAIDRPIGLAHAARGRAMLAAVAGRSRDALDECDAALTEHDRSQRPFCRARTQLVKGQIARRARQWGVARASLTEALDLFEHLGATLWAARARGEVNRIGGRSTSPSDLTDGERQVAELVAAGRANREVAEILFMSPRTVSTTLVRIYRKLGVSSRTEMAAQLARKAPKG